MIVAGRSANTGYTISLKDASLTVSINGQAIIACDRAGRLYSVYTQGRHHRRSLGGQVLQKWHTACGRQRQWLGQTEADALIDFAAGRLRQLFDRLHSPDWLWSIPPDRPEQLTEWLTVLARGARFDREAARSDAARFETVYDQIGVLPPDQYLALVLQATQGCSFNTCAFCDLYHQPFRVKTPDEFKWHIANVREYLGDSLLLRRRSIFIGAANALAVPMPRLLPLFETIAGEFDTTTHGVYAFLDAFTGTRKDVADYRALAGLGLRRVYVGLESGHDPLLEFVRKPGRAADGIDTVRTIRAAGVNVGVIVMIGLGGDRFAHGHITDTIHVLDEMQLGAGDLLYFSDLVEEPGTPYSALAAGHSIRALPSIERAAQRTAIHDRLRFTGSPPKISNYDIREFVY